MPELFNSIGAFVGYTEADLAALSDADRERYGAVAEAAANYTGAESDVIFATANAVEAEKAYNAACAAVQGPRMTVTQLAKDLIESNRRARGH